MLRCKNFLRDILQLLIIDSNQKLDHPVYNFQKIIRAEICYVFNREYL